MEKLVKKLTEYGLSLENAESVKGIPSKVKDEPNWKKVLGNYMEQELAFNMISVKNVETFLQKFSISEEYSRLNKNVFENVFLQLYPQKEEAHLTFDFLQNNMDDIIKEYVPEQLEKYLENKEELKVKALFDKNCVIEELKSEIEDEMWDFLDEVEMVNRTKKVKVLYNEMLEAIIE